MAVTNKPTAKSSRSWGKGPRALATVLPKVAEPALRKRGFSAVEIITNWREIVGPELAEETAPERLSFPRGARSHGTLHITAPGAVALEMQHLEPIILERINTYFGYGAVSRLAMTQGKARSNRRRKKPAAPVTRAVNPIRQGEIEDGTRTIEPEPLRDALRGLGKSIAWAEAKRRETT